MFYGDLARFTQIDFAFGDGAFDVVEHGTAKDNFLGAGIVDADTHDVMDGAAALADRADGRQEDTGNSLNFVHVCLRALWGYDQFFSWCWSVGVRSTAPTASTYIFPPLFFLPLGRGDIMVDIVHGDMFLGTWYARSAISL